MDQARPSAGIHGGQERSQGMNELDDMIAEGSPVFTCDSCGSDNHPNKRLVVDRDRKTGKVFGKLCPRCFFVVGYARENPDILREVALYLNRQDNAS